MYSVDWWNMIEIEVEVTSFSLPVSMGNFENQQVYFTAGENFLPTFEMFPSGGFCGHDSREFCMEHIWYIWSYLTFVIARVCLIIFVFIEKLWCSMYRDDQILYDTEQYNVI